MNRHSAGNRRSRETGERQNLVLAFTCNARGIPIAASLPYPVFGLLLSPIFAGATITMSGWENPEMVRRFSHLSADRLAPYADRLCGSSVVAGDIVGKSVGAIPHKFTHSAD